MRSKRKKRGLVVRHISWEKRIKEGDMREEGDRFSVFSCERDRSLASVLKADLGFSHGVFCLSSVF